MFGYGKLRLPPRRAVVPGSTRWSIEHTRGAGATTPFAPPNGASSRAGRSRSGELRQRSAGTTRVQSLNDDPRAILRGCAGCIDFEVVDGMLMCPRSHPNRSASPSIATLYLTLGENISQSAPDKPQSNGEKGGASLRSRPSARHRTRRW